MSPVGICATGIDRDTRAGKQKKIKSFIIGYTHATHPKILNQHALEKSLPTTNKQNLIRN
jgi:hypothetical protein